MKKVPIVLLFLLHAGATPSYAANSSLQDFFFAVCGSASGSLSARCAETNAGLGDLSSDSESSLNPSQTLGAMGGVANASTTRALEAREQSELRNGKESSHEVDIGPMSLLVSGDWGAQERDRRVDADAERGYEVTNWGLQLGMDYRLTDSLLIGGWLHWETSDLEFDQESQGLDFDPTGDAGRSEQDALGVSLLVSQSFAGGRYLDLTAGYLSSDYELERRSIFQESNRMVPTTAVLTSASSDGTERWASLLFGTSIVRGGWQLNPFVSLDYARIEIDSYTEQDLLNSGLAMQLDDVVTERFNGILGVSSNWTISGDGYVLQPHVRAEAIYALANNPITGSAQFSLDTDGNELELTADSVDRTYFQVGMGASLILPDGWIAFLEARSTLGRSDYENTSVVLGLRVEL